MKQNVVRAPPIAGYIQFRLYIQQITTYRSKLIHVLDVDEGFNMCTSNGVDEASDLSH